MFVDAGGIRAPNYVLRQLDNTTEKFEVRDHVFDRLSPSFLLTSNNICVLQDVIRYVGSKQQKVMAFGRELWWRGGTPPANEPKCGFKGDKPECVVQDQPTELIGGLSVLAVVVIGSAAIIHW